MEKVFEIYIKTTPERLWEAITNPEMRRKYNFGAGVESDWTPGSLYKAISPLAPAPIWEGENFILDERVHGKLTIISPTKMSTDEAYRAFQTALLLKGVTTVPAGGVMKIVPTKDAESSPIDTVLLSGL